MSRKVTINYKKIKKVINVDDLSDWEKVAEFLISEMKPGMVIALQGDLGAGKTTLTQHIAKQLGVSKRALSPTFSLIRNYNVGRGTIGTSDVGRLVHVDAYRIENERELFALDLDEELMEPGTVMVVEWPEKIAGWVAKQNDVVRVRIEMK